MLIAAGIRMDTVSISASRAPRMTVTRAAMEDFMTSTLRAASSFS